MAESETPLASARECVRCDKSGRLSLTSNDNLSRVTAPPQPFTAYPALTSKDADAEARASTTRRIARASVSEEPFHGRVTVHSLVESALFTISGTRDGFFLGFESSSATGASGDACDVS